MRTDEAGDTLATPAGQGDGGRDFAPGTYIAERRYRIVARIGEGGMGVVFRADDLLLNVPVALKRLTPRFAARRELLYQEVRTGRLISHPNVCRLHDVVEVEEGTFIAMELITGDDLGSLLARVGRFPSEKAVLVARDLCAALQAAHEAGIIHRDLKPANVMIDGRGVARVMDFGIAVAVDATVGGVAGTPQYMAPEQLEAQPASVRSDIYALGLVLYELFTGRPVFTATTIADLRSQHRAPKLPLHALVPEIDSSIEQAVERCLAEDPAARPRSVSEVLAALPSRDRLDAAVAAGETPAPEDLVDASGSAELTATRGIALAAALLAGLIACAFVHDRGTIEGLMGRVKSYETLADEARDAADVFMAMTPSRQGTTPSRQNAAQPRQAAGWFATDRTYVQRIATLDRSPSRWSILQRQPPSALHFVYRSSPHGLHPANLGAPVTANDPAENIPDMVGVQLGADGRLLRFRRVPPKHALASAQLVTDWAPAFAAAGIDARTLVPVPPEWTPPVGHDRRYAWTGRWASRADIPLRIEAASLGAMPVAFEVIEPWRDQDTMPRKSSAGEIALALLRTAAVILAIVEARRHLRAGRGDRTGARRIALFAFIAIALGRLSVAQHSGDPSVEIEILLRITGFALVIALQSWVIYLAVEPYVRQRWPHVLITWVRLLRGRWRNARVGADVLLGAAVGTWTAVVFTPYELLPALAGLSAPPLRSGLTADTMRRTIGIAGELSGAITTGIIYALGLLILSAVIRTVVKNGVAAFLATIALIALSGLRQDAPMLGYAMWLIASAVMLMLLRKSGLLATAVGFAVHLLLVEAPLTLDSDRWYSGRSTVVLATVLGIGVYGLAIALVRRRAVTPLIVDRTVTYHV